MPTRDDAPELKRCAWCATQLLPVSSQLRPGRPPAFCCELHRTLRRRALAKGRRYARQAAFWRTRLDLVIERHAVEAIVARFEALAVAWRRQSATGGHDANR
jgi:hypothetical protein